MRIEALFTLATFGVLLASGGTALAQQGYCDGVARDYADHAAASNTAGGALAGGVMGAVGGAVLGGIIDGNRGAANGAAIGGVGGALVGAGQGSQKWRRAYNQAYQDCMVRASSRPPAPLPGYGNNRPPPPPPGYAANRLPPGYDGAPPAWTREWYAYCGQRYRSFDPNTGYFIASGGVRKFCR
ncbi:BA14K-like protein [Kaistia soli DSM 19436]|uniref:Lectin-like protein BA14k n=1 Tax=Kaistia soli DSM 19436 TaxID=1122133 RepID=A0A1M5A8A7_9HYPH|nr:BA14K family protein [Kaistia soli]SHF26518.1 BA14K-like protein [Kaistia soli DSM 19436]